MSGRTVCGMSGETLEVIGALMRPLTVMGRPAAGPFAGNVAIGVEYGPSDPTTRRTHAPGAVAEVLPQARIERGVSEATLAYDEGLTETYARLFIEAPVMFGLLEQCIEVIEDFTVPGPLLTALRESAARVRGESPAEADAEASE